MNKHAYMIAVHKNQEQVCDLLEMLDNENNDIFIHIDIKSKLSADELKKHIRKGNIYFTKRYDVKWGRFEIVQSTLELLNTAVESGHHSYYHLISGQDLPLKNIKEINDFYDSNDNNLNYIELGSDEWSASVRKYRRYYHYLDTIKWVRPNKIRLILKKVILPFVILMKDKNVKYCGGPAWFDINEKMANFILEKSVWIEKNFKYDMLPDESFLQSLVRTFELEGSLFMGEKPIRRYIDWNRSKDGSSPYVFRSSDYDLLINSDMNFARKFDVEVDDEIIAKIKNKVINQ